MKQRESLIAWRLFELNWYFLGVLAVVLAAGLRHAGYTIDFTGTALCCAFVGLYAGVAYYNAKMQHRQDPQVVFSLGGTAQIVLTTCLATPLTYIAASFAFPLQDQNFYAIDRALGVDVRDYLAFVDRYPLLATWLQTGYGMIRWPLFGIPIILAAARRYERIQEFVLAFALALSVTVVISIFVPALGVFSLPDMPTSSNVSTLVYADSAREMSGIRDGSFRHLELLALTGVVTFPSFHAASAVLYLWALWPVRWIRPLAFIANILMIASCPVNGAHYFVDVLAGMAVAGLAIVAARQVSRRVAMRIPISADSATGAIPIPQAASGTPAAVPV